MLQLELMKTVVDGAIVDGDLSPLGTVCYIHRSDDVCALVVENETWFRWTECEFKYIRHLRWVSEDRVALWSVISEAGFTNSVRVFSHYESFELPIGLPKDLVFGRETFFASYGEDQYLRATDDQIEAHMIAEFDKSGKILFGLRDILNDGSWPESPTEALAGCIVQEREAVFAFNGCRDLWRISAVSSSISRIPLLRNVQEFLSISAAGERIFFVTAEALELKFGCVDLSGLDVSSCGSIPYSALNVHSGDYRSLRPQLRIHGNADGVMTIATRNAVWRVKLS